MGLGARELGLGARELGWEKTLCMNIPLTRVNTTKCWVGAHRDPKGAPALPREERFFCCPTTLHTEFVLFRQVGALLVDAKLYSYVGPSEITLLLASPSARWPLRSVTDVLNWKQDVYPALKHPVLTMVTVTFIIDRDATLWIADQHSEHLVCARGKAVIAAGELTFDLTHKVRITEITNQSTGYCPEPNTWSITSHVLQITGLPHPPAWTRCYNFRRCDRCATIAIIKDDDFECAVCAATLSHSWNLG